MSYGKKDEDADSGLVKIDRTQVFQEGECSAHKPAHLDAYIHKHTHAQPTMSLRPPLQQLIMA